MNHNQMNLHPPAHLHAQSHNSHNSQHSQHSNQSNQSQQQQGQGGNGQGVNVDDMFHQETGLDDADDEDDGDGESFFSLRFSLRVVELGSSRVTLAFSASSRSSLRGVATQQMVQGYIFPTEEIYQSVQYDSARDLPLSLHPTPHHSITPEPISFRSTASSLVALAPLEQLADIQKPQMVNQQNANVTHQVSLNQINQVDSHI
jgi:hypothetical protein